jgi:hypothetical protein
MIEYTHYKLDKENRSIAGSCTFGKEDKIRYKNRDVLYITGKAQLDTSCCSSCEWFYVTIPGYIVKWHNKANNAGMPVSEFEPVVNITEQDEIKTILRKTDEQVKTRSGYYFPIN